MKKITLFLFFGFYTLFAQQSFPVELSVKKDAYLFFPEEVIHMRFTNSTSPVKIKTDTNIKDMLFLTTDKAFTGSESLTIITASKQRYYLTVSYKDNPTKVEYDFTNSSLSEIPPVGSASSLKKELPVSFSNKSNKSTKQVCDNIASKYKRGTIHGGNGKKFSALSMEMYVKGIYYLGEKTYIQVLVVNNSKAQFIMDRDLSFSVIENGKEADLYPLDIKGKCQTISTLNKGANWFVYEFDKISTSGQEPLVVNLTEERKDLNNVNLRSLRIETLGDIFASAKILNKL